MFTGIIETTGIIEEIIKDKKNISLWIHSNISKELQINQSLSHNGVCLTIEQIKNNIHKVTLIAESLQKTTFTNVKKNQLLNLERCLKIGDRLDGHFVQGHVDTTATIIKKIDKKGSTLFTFKLPNKKNKKLFVEKGSITINGISLTCFDTQADIFSVAVIPHTLQLTNMLTLKLNDLVNIEFDILGKYMLK